MVSGDKDKEQEEKMKQMQAQLDAASGKNKAPGMKKGGKVSSASSRADGCATKGKTKGRFV
jgi:hypothetical protein